MKKKLLVFCLTLAMTAAVLPTNVVFAETGEPNVVNEESLEGFNEPEEKKLPTPILEWNTKPGRLTITIPSGDWDELKEAGYELTVINTDTNKVFETFSDSAKLPVDGEGLCLGYRPEDELETGNYKAELYLCEDGDWAQSDTAVLEFAYTNPGVKYGDFIDVAWDNGELSFTAPEDVITDNAKVFFLFAKKENGKIRSRRYCSDRLTDLSDSMERFEKLVQGSGEGDYYFRMRALSGNLNEKYHGDWSAWSDAYTISNENGGTETPATDIWDGTVATSFAGGSGTEEDPYLIENGAQLSLIAEYKDSCFRLIDDIYLNDVTNWEEWTAEDGPDNVWTPPYYYSSFGHIFDGDGHTIYGLYTDASQSHQGLLYQISPDGYVKDLEIDKSKIFGTSYVGSIAARNYGVIENCVNKATVTATEEDGGGIAGSGANASTVVKNCTNYGDISCAENGGGIIGGIQSGVVVGCANYGNVTGINPEQLDEAEANLGGITGSAYKDSTVCDCINYGAVSGVGRIGGICGYVYGGDVSKCENNGDVTAEQEQAGGIAGAQQGRNESDISVVDLCVNNGAVGTSDSSRKVGGIIGSSGGSCEIRNCYNTGEVEGFSGIGGLIGELRAFEACPAALVENCYSVGTVFGKKQVSGTVAEAVAYDADTTVTIRNCYCLNDASAEVTLRNGSGTETVTNVLALPKSEMGKQSSFEGFDFKTIWYCAGDGSYPVLLTGGEEGELGDAATFVYYPEISVIVTAEKNMQALLASYENGKMKALEMVKLSAGEDGTLALKNWGEDVKLFAISVDQKPLCEPEEL